MAGHSPAAAVVVIDCRKRFLGDVGRGGRGVGSRTITEAGLGLDLALHVRHFTPFSILALPRHHTVLAAMESCIEFAELVLW